MQTTQFEAEGDIGADDETCLDWQAVPFVPDSLHIIHNVTADMLEAIASSEDIKPHFKAIAIVLRNKLNREALQGTCLSDADRRVWAYRFNTWNAHLIEWRWGSIAKFVEALATVELPLKRFFWDMRKFTDRKRFQKQRKSCRWVKKA